MTSSSGKPVLFLDVDGVLNDKDTPVDPRTGYTGIEARLVRHINRVLDESGAVCVLSSSWRTDKTQQYSEEAIARTEADLIDCGFTHKIFSATPVIKGRFSEYISRGREIQAWLDDHPGYGPIAVVDDVPDMDHLMPWLVLTDMDIGITHKDASELIELLRGIR
jgi:hypothetical protein